MEESWRAKKVLLSVRVAGRVVKRRSPTWRVMVLMVGDGDGGGGGGGVVGTNSGLDILCFA